MLIVADSSPLIALATCRGLHLLDQLYSEVNVPEAVYSEVCSEEKPFRKELADYLQGKVQNIDLASVIIETGNLGRGELEAMALFRRLNADQLLVDDDKARRIARLNGISVIGSVGILILAKREGLVSEITSFLRILENSSIYLSPSLIQTALHQAGE